MEAYQHYRNNRLYVNRRYQRKLVWTTQEKQSLIDTIILKYPVPLFLFAQLEDGKLEIIDGMQRLNAIFGFIENEFPYIGTEEKFFDVSHYTFAKSQADNGVFNERDKEENEFLTQEQVSNFISYPMPVTIFKATDEDEVNETFRRINSNGRHLSPQEVRQAGNTTQFADLVRELASEIRGDASQQVLLLSQLPSISIDNRQSHGYGITAEDTFWCKHGIIRTSDLRESEDEQFIADIILSIALGTPFPASKKEFNNYYGTGNKDKTNEIEIKINAVGKENIKTDIKTVISELINFADTYLDGNSLKRVVNPTAGGNPVKEDFYTIFMSFYELIIIENKTPFDFNGIKAALTNVHARLTRDRNYTTTPNRIANIAVCKGLLEPHFNTVNATFRSSTSITMDFQNYLMRSKVEAANYDYKQGLYTLNPSGRELLDTTFENKILKNIAAMANLGKDKNGFLFLGVTDKEDDTLKVEVLDGLTDVPRYHGFGVVGLEREAILKGVSLDEYVSYITQKISDSELPEALKKRITKSITPITYHGNTVLMIEIESGTEPVYFKDELYQRDGANCKVVRGAAQGDIFKLFQ